MTYMMVGIGMHSKVTLQRIELTDNHGVYPTHTRPNDPLVELRVFVRCAAHHVPNNDG